MKKTYRGSCHCGAVAFEADFDLAAGTYKCNCTICAKSRYWGATVSPGDFRLLRGDCDLTLYQYNTRRTDILFCKHCGIPPFTRGDLPEAGGAFVSVNVAALDGVAAGELLAGPITYLDGLHDSWTTPPVETRRL